MNTELRLHGHIDDSIEYFATAAGRAADRHHFYQSSGDSLRFFAPGNAFILSPTGVRHEGNGGSFCEYMFGVEQPLSDLAKGDIRNRLVLYGTTYDEQSQLHFSSLTEGEQEYEKIFFQGNAVCNNFFFLNGDLTGNLQQQQQQILRLLGRILKRTERISGADDASLVEELLGQLPQAGSLYLFRLIHKKHRRYQEAFRQLYFRHRTIPDQDYAELQQLAEELGIDRYQQERIRIDVMYKHPENHRIVDEYKKVLIDCSRQGHIDRQQNARLTRLKTLSVRNKIPPALFITLDDLLKTDTLDDLQEQEYISTTRQILQGLFLHGGQIDASIDHQDMVQLLFAKQRAHNNRDHTFEQLLLETGKICDEQIRDGADLSLLENFSYLITFFDRYDSTSTNISQLAFMENFRLTEELVRSLLGNQEAFNGLEEGLFGTLFFEEIADNDYLGRFGRRKIDCLRRGLQQIGADRLTVQDLLDQLNEIDRQERLYQTVLEHVKERIRNFYSRYNTKAEQDDLLQEISCELLNKGVLSEAIPPELFRDVVLNIKKEAIYLHNLLPQIVASQDRSLREDFLVNSGLDRFYVEELEREYFAINQLDPEQLNQLRANETP